MSYSKILAPMFGALMFLMSGCLATQDWVQTHVTEQLFPINKRISDTEAGLTQTNGRVSGLEGQVQQMSAQIAQLDSRVNESNAKADRALEQIQHLKLDRKLSLDMKSGAFFKSNSTVLTAEAKREIDSFLSDLKADADGTSRIGFLVAGYTDNVGSAKYNYELARLRADNVATYLTTQKKIDPGSVSVLSFGESDPVADNSTEAGRAKNRRVEILIYKDTIGVASGGQSAAAR